MGFSAWLCRCLSLRVSAVLVLLLVTSGASRASTDSADHLQLLAAFDSQWAATQARVGPPRRSLATRTQALLESRRRLEAHNALHAAGARSYFLAWNDLSDLSDAEYRSFLRSRPDAINPQTHHRALLHHPGAAAQEQKEVALTFDNVSAWSNPAPVTAPNDSAPIALPKNWNWLEVEGGRYLTPVKNQGTCGSCWAFTAIAVIESRYAIEQKLPATPLSVEQVLSCSAPLDRLVSKFPEMSASSEGCEGGMPFLAYEYMARMAPHGIACEREYPYETIQQNNEEALMRAVLSGPVAANIDSFGDGFRHYGGGIYDASDCKSDGKEVNHAVVVVGYGETDQGEKYWIIRNTWGTMWGENGYMRIMRGNSRDHPHGPCNLYLFPTFPTKLAVGSIGAATCSLPEQKFVPLGSMALLDLDGSQWLLLIAVSLGVIIVGMIMFITHEGQQQRRYSSGNTTYEDCYDRWILPSKEQLSVMLERRRGRIRTA
ncbi:hypothetical protein ATCC90586_008208 [Pythium insidiosum]|nr:hypothetical protein ATCC90586_008208 [Pythium insidiosum]